MEAAATDLAGAEEVAAVGDSAGVVVAARILREAAARLAEADRTVGVVRRAAVRRAAVRRVAADRRAAVAVEAATIRLRFLRVTFLRFAASRSYALPSTNSCSILPSGCR